jgi:hypothetical protein
MQLGLKGCGCVDNCEISKSKEDELLIKPTKQKVVHPYPNSTISYLLVDDLNIKLASY